MRRPIHRPIYRAIQSGLLTRPGGSVFSPALLFTGGFQGAWYDFSDMSTLFQDSAGTTPVTAVEQPIGRVNDKSGNGNHAIQSTSSKKPVLSARKNLLLATTTLSTQNVTTEATQYTLSHTGTGTITLSGAGTGSLVGAGSLTFTPTAGTLTLTVSGTVTNAQLEYGASATSYQRVTTATDYDTVGFPHYAKFDGVDDALASAASINFTATDKMSVFVGLTKLSDAANGMVVESSVGNAVGSFYVLCPPAASYQFALTGSTATAGSTYTTYTAPIKNVLAIQYDIAQSTRASEIVSRINGTNVSESSGVGAEAGSGNFTSQPIYIGSRGAASLPFNGQINQLAVVGKTASAGEVTSTEQFIASKTGVTL